MARRITHQKVGKIPTFLVIEATNLLEAHYSKSGDSPLLAGHSTLACMALLIVAALRVGGHKACIPEWLRGERNC